MRASDDNAALPSSSDSATVRFHPPLGLLTSLTAATVGRWFVPLTFLPEQASSFLGAGVVGASVIVFFWAARTMRANGASLPPGLPTEVLVSRGPYRFSRNPIYLSMLLLHIGMGIWTDSFWFVIAAGIFAVVLYRGVIRNEEDYLARKFPQQYSNYRSRVRRWL